MKTGKCCVMTRSFYEDQYIDFFVEYYLKLCFDHIFIIKTDNIPINTSKYGDRVTIMFDSGIEHPNSILTKYMNIVKNKNVFEWMLHVDVDEFLMLQNNNIKIFINGLNEEIINVRFRWGLIEKLDNSDLSLNEIVSEYPIIKNRHVKSMAKLKYVKDIPNPHIFRFITDAVNSYPQYQNCHHSPIIPAERLGSYDNNNFILHVHTRSINNMLLKSFVTNFVRKEIVHGENMNEFINKYADVEINNDIYIELSNIIGAKMRLPHSHYNGNNENITISQIVLKKFNIRFCDHEKEKSILCEIIKKKGYDMRLLKIIDRMNEKFIETKKLGHYIYLVPHDFNWKEYVEHNSDLKHMNKIQAYNHYMFFGYRENRVYKINLPIDFNPKKYREINADLSNMNDKQCISHYIRHGKGENRKYR
jgi:hypothetical protein